MPQSQAADDQCGGGKTRINQEGSRLTDLMVQFSTYGKAIPIIYGNSRIAGNVIWSRPIQEHVTTSTQSSGGGKGGGGGGGGGARGNQVIASHVHNDGGAAVLFIKMKGAEETSR